MSPKAEKADKPAISVIERRLQGKSALQATSLPIPLKEKGWTVMWFNADISADHVWNAVNVLGWEYVLSSDIGCQLEEVGANERDGKVVRGERGKEVLLKMREADYKKVQSKKTRENLDVTFNPKRMKDTAVNAVGQAFGGEAAEFIDKSGLKVDDSRERVSLDE
jgi:hypothetical protein